LRTWIAILFRPAAAHGAVVAARAENARVVLMALHFHWRCSQIEEDGFALHAFVHLRRGAQTLLPLVVKFQTAHTTNVAAATGRGGGCVKRVIRAKRLYALLSPSSKVESTVEKPYELLLSGRLCY
jgi:hypothetical protein